jgi:hypothetical protein
MEIINVRKFLLKQKAAKVAFCLWLSFHFFLFGGREQNVV